MSSSEWKECLLGDVAEVIGGYAFKAKDFIEDGVPVIKIKNIVPPVIDITDVQYVSDELYNEKEKYRLGYNDILISLTGSHINQLASAVGKLGRVKIKNKKLLLNQRVGKVYVKDSKNYHEEFLYYFLSQDTVRYDLAISAGGSANQANISPQDVKNISIPLPPLKEQKAIANVLSSLDDKIELNNQMNKTLEEMAQALFKRWFVDFEFPNEEGEPYKSSGGEMVDSELGMIPKGWKVGLFEDLVIVKYGKDHKKLLEGKIPVYGSGGIMRYVDKALYDKESVLIPRKGTLNNVIYINRPFWSVDTMFFTEMKKENIAKFIYFYIKSKDLASMNSGSAVPSMTTNILNSLKVVISDSKVIYQFDKIVSTLMDNISRNNVENSKLQELRDTLLPKLMSGEIRVKDIQS